MKATYNGFTAQRTSGFAQLPPPGAYVAQIQGVRLENSYSGDRENLVLMLEITEGEYKDQYHKVFEDQTKSFGSGVKYRGTLKLVPPVEGDESWVRSRFEGNLWCVEQSNPGYAWDWNENGLKGKTVGISVRTCKYTGQDGTEKETTEIAQLETVADVKAGKCRILKERIQKPRAGQTGMTDVSNTIEVPF